MAVRADVIIRGGTLADGNGGELYEADVAIAGDRIVEVGRIAASAAEEIDARGMLVTPGFVDLHTHLDGHVTWESRLQPVTGHGVTTVVMGNCGVGFAPCRPEDRDTLIGLMETVEDIPFKDLTAGLPWSWQSFPEYLDALSQRQYNMDIGTLLPHSTLRAYVMGKRSLGQTANTDEIAQMAQLTRDAVEAGALGFGSSTLRDQRTRDGRNIPSVSADESEFTAIAQAMTRAGRGVLQIAIEFNQFPLACEELEMFVRIGRASGRPVMYSLKQTNGTPEGWRQLLAISDRANREGVAMRPQVLGRPTGAIMSLDGSFHPFARCASFAPLVALPRAQKVAAMRDPALRARLIDEANEAQQRRPERVRGYRLVFQLGDPPNYEPLPEHSIEVQSNVRGVAAVDLAYDILLENEGRGMLMLAGGNYADFNLDAALAMMRNPFSVPGLGDAGAHASIICDASIPTYLLSYWTRERTRGERLPLERVVRWLTRDCADVIGLNDRGRVMPGFKADLNVIDQSRLRLRAPRTVFDLPAGSPRLVQDAEGYVATLVSGQIVQRHDAPTGRLPGRLVRSQPAAATARGAAA
jgi:N-acyl-D-aspartate/D-glutamate deacylase